MRTISACLTTAVLAGLATVAAQRPPATAKADPDKIQQGSGKLPDGWQARLDDDSAKLADVIVEAKDDALTFTTGPAGIYYKPGMKAEKDFELTAVFSQLKPSAHPEAYGLFIAGQDLDKPTLRYTYFLIRQDGRFLIKSRSGAATNVIVNWTAATPMKEPKGVKASNTLLVRASGADVRFFIDGKQVHKLTRAEAGGDGIAGLRVNHNLHLQVSKLDLKKL